jgi:hypothetical protein
MRVLDRFALCFTPRFGVLVAYHVYVAVDDNALESLHQHASLNIATVFKHSPG